MQFDPLSGRTDKTSIVSISQLCSTCITWPSYGINRPPALLIGLFHSTLCGARIVGVLLLHSKIV